METKTNTTYVVNYFRLSEYNSARILEKIAECITNDGGRVLRSKYDKNILAYCSTFGNCKNVEKRQQIEGQKPILTPFWRWSGGGLRYVKNGFYYSISYDSSPLFPIIYQKIKIDENGGYYGRRYALSSEPLNDAEYKKSGDFVLSFCYDCIFGVCDDETINRIAKLHYEQIKNVIEGGKESESGEPEYKRVRVPNYYNNGWHYENKPLPVEHFNVFEDLTDYKTED